MKNGQAPELSCNAASTYNNDVVDWMSLSFNSFYAFQKRVSFQNVFNSRNAALFFSCGGFDRPQGSTYGYGFSREEILSDLVVGHNGGAEGINGDMDIYWKSGYVVIALANLDPRAAEEITKWIKERIQL